VDTEGHGLRSGIDTSNRRSGISGRSLAEEGGETGEEKGTHMLARRGYWLIEEHKADLAREFGKQLLFEVIGGLSRRV